MASKSEEKKSAEEEEVNVNVKVRTTEAAPTQKEVEKDTIMRPSEVGVRIARTNESGCVWGRR